MDEEKELDGLGEKFAPVSWFYSPEAMELFNCLEAKRLGLIFDSKKMPSTSEKPESVCMTI